MNRETTPAELADAIWQHYAGAPAGPLESDQLEAIAERFISLKQYLGHRYHASGKYVRQFVRDLQARGVTRTTGLSVGAMVAWVRSHDQMHHLTWIRKMGAISVFMEHLKALGYVVNNPCLFLRRRVRSNFRPYIFTTQELQRIFTAADPRALVYHFIYACGLRASEAVHLALRHFDAERGTVFIERTKFNKDRLLPLHPRMLELLRQHREEHRAAASPKSPFFVDALGRPCTYRRLARDFHEILQQLGIYHSTRDVEGVRYGSPRVHSLRHSFAVHRLLRWYRAGADVQAKLPLLSTYLGHAQIEYTQVYLTVTGLLLREAHRRFAGRWEREYPLAP